MHDDDCMQVHVHSSSKATCCMVQSLSLWSLSDAVKVPTGDSSANDLACTRNPLNMDPFPLRITAFAIALAS